MAMERKIDKLVAFMKNEEWGKALALAAKWPRLGEYKEAIVSGNAAYHHSHFYRQLGKDVEGEINRGINALKSRYGHLL